MSTDYDEIDTSVIGIWSPPTVYVVSREHIAAYADATGDRHPRHASGIQAPIVFAVVPPFALLAERAMSPMPAHLMLTILHGEHDIRQVRPIRGGDVLTSRSKVVGVHGTSSGIVVTTLTETRDHDGALVNQQHFGGFFRGGRLRHDVGSPFPDHAVDPVEVDRDADLRAERTFEPDQTFRYAAASGDPMPIHTDDEIARAMGLPGIIVHGLCSMAFTASALVDTVCPDDPARLKRLAVRFSGFGRPGQTLTTSAWDLGERDGSSRFAVTATSDTGTHVITGGLAEIRRRSVREIVA